MIGLFMGKIVCIVRAIAASPLIYGVGCNTPGSSLRLMQLNQPKVPYCRYLSGRTRVLIQS